MNLRLRLSLWVALAALAFACAAPPSPPPSQDAGLLEDAGFFEDAGTDAGVADKSANCASTFGHSLTAAFGRLDGTVVAVLTPEDTQCALPNNDHVIVQVRVNGEVYRMVVNIQSSYGDPNVRFGEVQAPLVGGAWSEGWHTGTAVDYATTLGLHADQAPFTAYPMDTLAQTVDARIPLEQHISVFAESSGGTYADSAHKIHRNGYGNDGAIVLDPESASPRWLLFHFGNQSF